MKRCTIHVNLLSAEVYIWLSRKQQEKQADDLVAFINKARPTPANSDCLESFASGTPCDIRLKVSQDYPLYNKFFQKLRFCLGKMESAPEGTEFFMKLALLRAWKRVTPTAVVDKGISSSYI